MNDKAFVRGQTAKTSSTARWTCGAPLDHVIAEVMTALRVDPARLDLADNVG